MTQYRMQWESMTGHLPWQYDFDINSDIMAIEYTKRHVANSPGFRIEGMAMLLWRLEDEKLIGRFVLDRPTIAHVRNTVKAEP